MGKSKKLLVIGIVLFVLQIVILTGATTFQLSQETGKMDYFAGFLASMVNFFQYFVLVIPSLLCFFFYFKSQNKKTNDTENKQFLESHNVTAKENVEENIIESNYENYQPTPTSQQIPLNQQNSPPQLNFQTTPEFPKTLEEIVEEQYQKAIRYMNMNSVENICKATDIFVKLQNYKSSVDCLAFCKQKATEMKKREKVSKFNDKKKIIVTCSCVVIVVVLLFTFLFVVPAYQTEKHIQTPLRCKINCNLKRQFTNLQL